MAKKIRKQKQKQKQKQVQNVNQKVIVRIGDVSKKKSRRRRSTRKPKEPTESSMMQSLQPNVIYQSYKPEQISAPQPVTQNIPLEPAPTATNMVPETVKQPTARGAFQDVGVGTEGFVTILSTPTKREQLEELITPVSKPLPVASTGELPPWLREERPNPAFVEPSFYKSPEKPSSAFSTTPIKPSLESPPWLASGFETPFTPSPFYAEPTDISKTVDVQKELTELADFINNAAYPIGRPVEGPSITESLPVQQSQPENYKSINLEPRFEKYERNQMGKEDISSTYNQLSQFNFKPPGKPTFFEKLQEIKQPSITSRRTKPEIKEARQMGIEDINRQKIIVNTPQTTKPESVKKKIRARAEKKLTELEEQKRQITNAKARARYAKNKVTKIEGQQTIPIY
jgi:hypothetical protein